LTAQLLDISEVVRRSGIPATTLHVWERHRLVEPVSRTGLRRVYSADVLDTIALVVICQRSGFSLAEIAQLLEPDAFADGKQRLVAKLDELRARRAELDHAIAGLEHALACESPSPLECDKFRRELTDVLPVDRHSRRGRQVVP
jgi:DNA-binding transcriptional MerR regulator